MVIFIAFKATIFSVFKQFEHLKLSLIIEKSSMSNAHAMNV